MGHTQKIVIVVGVLLTAGVGGVLLCTDLGRAVRGISTFGVLNASGRAVTDVSLEMRHSAGTEVVEWPTLEANERENAGVKTADLYLERLMFTLDGVSREYGQGEQATTGEVVLLVIQADGSVQSRHDW